MWKFSLCIENAQKLREKAQTNGKEAVSCILRTLKLLHVRVSSYCLIDQRTKWDGKQQRWNAKSKRMPQIPIWNTTNSLTYLVVGTQHTRAHTNPTDKVKTNTVAKQRQEQQLSYHKYAHCSTKKKITIIRWKVSTWNALSCVSVLCMLANRDKCKKKVSTQLQQTFPTGKTILDKWICFALFLCALLTVFTCGQILHSILSLHSTNRASQHATAITISQILCLN